MDPPAHTSTPSDAPAGLVAASEPLARPARRLSCRVIYLQATSEEPASVVDHLELEAEGSYRLYQTTCW